MTVIHNHFDYHQRGRPVFVAVVPLPRDRQLHADHQLRMDSPPSGSLPCRSFFILIFIFIFIFGLTTIQILITTQVRLPIIAPTIAFFSPVLNANIECNQEMNREQTETGVSTFSTPLLTLTGSLFSFNNRVALLY